jgi:hypothetical protein
MKKQLLLLAVVFTITTMPAKAQTLVNLAEIDTLGHPSRLLDFITAKSDYNGNFYVLYNVWLVGDMQCLGILKLDNNGNNVWGNFYCDDAAHYLFAAGLAVSDNAVYAAAFNVDSANATSVYKTIKLNAATGDTLWTADYAGSYGGYDIATAIAVDDTGNIYTTGTEQSGVLDSKITVVKYDSTGSQLWTSSYDSTGMFDGAVAMQLDPSKDVAVTGFSGTGFSSWDFVTVGFNPHTGVKQAYNRSPNGNGSFSQPVALRKDQYNNFYVLGTSAVSGSNTDIKLIKYDSLFNEQWAVSYGDSLLPDKAAMLQYKAYSLIACGTSNKANGGKDIVTLKYDDSGNLLWSRHISAPNPIHEASAVDLIVTDDKNIYVTGKWYNGSDTDVVTFSYDFDGNLRWLKTYSRTANSNDHPNGLHQNDQGKIVVLVGSYAPTDTFYFKVKYEEWVRTTQVAIDTDSIPIFAKKNIIVRFDTSLLNYDAINNEDLVYGGMETFFKDSVTNLLDSVLPREILRASHFIKLAPHYHTWDTTLVSNIGDTVKIPPFWSSFLMVYDGGDSSEQQYCDSFMLLSPLIKWAHLNYMMHNFSCSSSPTAGCTSIRPTDDFYCNNQYALHDDDATHNYTNGNINAEGAWALETGKSFVKVGVFDSGIKWTHEDFQKKFGETKIKGGFDYVIHQSPILQNDIDPDYSGHGTSCAGIIGALRNNSIGISGLAGGSWCDNPLGNDPSDDMAGVSLYSLGTSTPINGATVTVMASEIIAMNDALSGNVLNTVPTIDIGNFSHGLPGTINEFQDYTEKFYQAFRLGKILVAARGNLDLDHIHGNETMFPACFNDDWVLNVGGSNADGDRAEAINNSSMYGDGLDVVAPYFNTMNYTTGVSTNSDYSVASGTSISAPYVTGLAGLLLSYKNDPLGIPNYNNLAPEDIEEIIQRTAYYDLGKYGYGMNGELYSNETGWGRIDAGNALNLVNKSTSRLLHFNSLDFSTITTPVQVAANINITLMNNDPNDLSVLAGTYQADVWRYTQTVSHNITLNSNENIVGFWARSSASNSYPLYINNGSENQLTAYEKAIVDEVNMNATATNATIWGYYYKLNPGTSNEKWIPHDPTQNTANLKMSYTILTHISTPLETKEIKSDLALTIYPNPTSNLLHLNLISEKNAFYTIKLYSAIGQQISVLFSGYATTISQDYDLGVVNSGMYYVQLTSAQQTKKLNFVIIK